MNSELDAFFEEEPRGSVPSDHFRWVEVPRSPAGELVDRQLARELAANRAARVIVLDNMDAIECFRPLQPAPSLLQRLGRRLLPSRDV